MLRLAVRQGEASMARSVHTNTNIAVMSLLYYSDGQSAVYYPLPTSPKCRTKRTMCWCVPSKLFMAETGAMGLARRYIRRCSRILDRFFRYHRRLYSKSSLRGAGSIGSNVLSRVGSVS